MLIFGITNKINKDLGLFFYDYDNAELDLVLDEAKFLSECFDIDIYVLKTSKNSFHLISFDILEINEISSIQNWTSLESDYINIKDLECNMFNILRLGSKGSKRPPEFIEVFYAKKNTHLKSLRHYKVYRKLFNIPQIQQKDFINVANENLIMYNSHKVEKVVINKKWIS